MEPPPAGASSVDIAELREGDGDRLGLGMGMGGDRGRGMEEGEMVVRDGVAYRWALMPVGNVAGESQGHENMQMAERGRSRDIEEVQPVAGPSGPAHEAQGPVVGRAATPLREDFQDHDTREAGQNVGSGVDSEADVTVVRR